MSDILLALFIPLNNKGGINITYTSDIGYGKYVIHDIDKYEIMTDTKKSEYEIIKLYSDNKEMLIAITKKQWKEMEEKRTRLKEGLNCSVIANINPYDYNYMYNDLKKEYGEDMKKYSLDNIPEEKPKFP